MSRTAKYWIAQISGWFGYFIFLLFITFVLKDSYWSSPLFIKLLLNIFVGLITTHCLRLIYLRFNLNRQPTSKSFFYVFVLSISMALVMTIAIELIETFLNFDNSTATINTFLFQFFGNALLITIWNLIYFLYHFIVLTYEERIRILSLESSQHKAELNQLKNQLNPHFLFNSLNGIRALITLNPIDAKNAITNLSGLLRSTLNSGKLDKINLSDEIKMVENYLDLEQMRFEDRLNVKWIIDIKNKTIQIPPFTLQLLVENAIKHGISASSSGGEITIKIREQEDNVQVIVINSGSYEPTHQGGIGIQNLTYRLSYFYGENVMFSIENKNNNVHTEINIPIQNL